jgi:predicted RNA-binding protein with PIN domain
LDIDPEAGNIQYPVFSYQWPIIMPLHIIIDGYNLIRQSSRFSDIDSRDIQAGRQALIDMLAAYKRVRAHRITVVFDGTHAPPYSVRSDRSKGVEIRFSRDGETADAVIKRMSSREGEKALIVSSDNDVVNHAQAQGSATIDSPGFEYRMVSANFTDSPDSGEADPDSESGWIPTTKKKGPSRRRSKKERRRMTRIGKL